jgi:gas vesicle protein
MGKKTIGLLSFLSGATTGAILGILYAPDKGTETRDRLSYRLERFRSKLSELSEDLIAGRDAIPSVAKSEGQRVIQDARTKAEKLLGDVDQLIHQINSQKEV